MCGVVSKKYKEAINELYDMMFTPEFLIKFGYYDVSVKKNISGNKALKEQDNNVDNLAIEDAYGKADAFFYAIFNTEDLSRLITKHISNPELEDVYSFFNFENLKTNLSTEPILFYYP